MNQYLSRLKDSGFFVLCNYFGQKSLNMLLLRAILWLNRGISFVLLSFSARHSSPFSRVTHSVIVGRLRIYTWRWYTYT